MGEGSRGSGEQQEPTEGSSAVVSILQETADRFNSLLEAARASLAGGDTHARDQTLRQRGQLLVDLPERIRPSLAGLDGETRERVSRDIRDFAQLAREALEHDSTGFMLQVLLTDQGSKIGDKNHLEQLIESLK